jgi:hypothetical protein
MLGSQGRHYLFLMGGLSHRRAIIRGFAAAARREPPLAPLTNPVENAIEAARRRGEFENLSGAGKPLPKGDMPVAGGRGSSPSDLLSKKAEFEMRRAIRNNELENLGGEGKKLKYKGTAISTPTIGGEGGQSISNYVLVQADMSAEDMKKVK